MLWLQDSETSLRAERGISDMWYEKSGKDSDIVLYSRACIYRNIKGYPFPDKMMSGDRNSVIDVVRNAMKDSNLSFVRLDELDEKGKEELYNQYFATYEFLQDGGISAFLIGKDSDVCVTINRKEHVEIDSIRSGNDMIGAYKAASDIALELEKNADVAFSEKFGFLTSDLRLIGTAVQIGFFVAIPGIEKTQNAYRVLEDRLNKFDWKIETATAPGEAAQVSLYLVHNVATLGVSETDLLKTADQLIKELMYFERKCRKNIMRKKSMIVNDLYYRAYGLLRYARKVTTAEVMNQLSWLRLGLDSVEDDETDIDWMKLNLITHEARRDYGTVIMGGNENTQKAIRRAERVRKILKGDDAK